MPNFKLTFFTLLFLTQEIPSSLAILNPTSVDLSQPGPNILIDYADPWYIGLKKMKQNVVNGTENLFDINIEDVGNEFIVLISVPEECKMATFYNPTTFTKRMCVVWNNVLQFYGPSQILLH